MFGEPDNVPSAARFWFAHESKICLHPFRYRSGDMDSLPHTHDEYNILFCLTPGLSFSLRGRVELLMPGDILVINPGEVHNGHYGAPGVDARGLTLHIPVRTLKEILVKMRFPCDLERKRVVFGEKIADCSILPLIESLIHEINQRQSGYELVVDSLVLQILVHLFRGSLQPCLEPLGREPARQLPSWQIVRTFEYMNTRGKSRFSVAELCSEIGTSTSRFIQLFKNSVCSMNPHVYYNRLIVDKAQRILAGSDVSIKTVAYDLGFQNESHFCKVFRTCAGVTPRNFREQANVLKLL